jgi:putative transposase
MERRASTSSSKRTTGSGAAESESPGSCGQQGSRDATGDGATGPPDGTRAPPPPPDLVARNFTAAAPDRLWTADITYVPTWSGFLYLAVVIDAFSRAVVGWSMRADLTADLVVEALEMAIYQRDPETGVIHHSDQGCQYTSLAFGSRCRDAGIVSSMGSVGDCFDNALTESFFATLECELIDRSVFHNHSEARLAVFDYVEAFYNPRRRHSSIDYLSPVAYERRWREQQSA